MIDRIPSAATAPLPSPERAVSPAGEPTPATFAGELDTAIPSAPPAEVLQELDKAGHALRELADKHIEVRFHIDESQRVHVTMLDASGNVIRRIPARGLLDALAGRGLSFDTTA
ncbi:MAG: hypothetical protein ACJ757_09245 [Gaiellaceae bacterium]